MIHASSRIPVTVAERIESLAPWAAFLALDDGGPAILLESARVDPRIGRYSIVATRPTALWHARGDVCTYEAHGVRRVYRANPADDLRRLMALRRAPLSRDVPFTGGALGFVSYEARHAFEDLPQRAVDDLRLPHWWFIFVDECLVFDHIAGTVTGVVVVDRPTEIARATDRAAKLIRDAQGAPKRLLGPVHSDGVLQSTFYRPAFEDAVRRILEYIAAGDVYQVILSQRLETTFRGDPRTLYAVLRAVNPSPFAASFPADASRSIGCSPERLVLFDGGRAETRRIRTRPRGRRYIRGQPASPGTSTARRSAPNRHACRPRRNDLGRVCRYGTVHADELMARSYSHVNNREQRCRRAHPGKDAVDLLPRCSREAPLPAARRSVAWRSSTNLNQ